MRFAMRGVLPDRTLQRRKITPPIDPTLHFLGIDPKQGPPELAHSLGLSEFIDLDRLASAFPTTDPPPWPLLNALTLIEWSHASRALWKRPVEERSREG